MKAIAPRDYSYRLPKKAIQIATRMAVASRIISEQVVLVVRLWPAVTVEPVVQVLQVASLGQRCPLEFLIQVTHLETSL